MQHIIFDIGNVLFGYDPRYIIKQLIPKSEYKNTFLEGLFNHQAWQDLDRGDITWDEAHKHLEDHYNLPSSEKLTTYTLIHNFVYHLTPLPTIYLFKALQKTHSIYLLSNFQDKPFDTLETAHPFLQEANGKVISAKENCMKPESKIYTTLLDRYSLDPKECYFIDDREENINAAQQLGIDGHVFHSAQHLQDILLKKGLLKKPTL
jgi:putative hydrolase of the HAD superfamily